MSQMPPELDAAAARLGLRIESVLRRTDKTLLADGELDGTRVAVKYLLDPDPFWAAKWLHEVRVYALFAESPPPLRLPRLLHTDGSRLLVLEWLDGRRLDDQRYPEHPVAPDDIDAAIGCITALNGWRGPADQMERIFDYAERFARYHSGGFLTDNDLNSLTRVLKRCGNTVQINHGDPVPSNILIAAEGTAFLLDWEFTGLFLPGFDLAMLHTQLGAHTPAVKQRIEATVADTGIEDAFAVNLAAVLTRELRIHRELPASPARDSRLEELDQAWAHGRQRLHDLDPGRS